MPIVDDVQANVRSRRFGPELETAFGDVDFAHRIGGIQDEIEQHLLQLHAPAVDDGQRRREIGAGRDMADQQFGAQQIERLPNQLVEVEGIRLHVAAPVQRSQAANDLRRPVVVGHDIVADSPELGEIDLLPGEHFPRGLGIAEDRGERLVQLMRDGGR